MARILSRRRNFQTRDGVDLGAVAHRHDMGRRVEISAVGHFEDIYRIDVFRTGGDVVLRAVGHGHDMGICIESRTVGEINNRRQSVLLRNHLLLLIQGIQRLLQLLISPVRLILRRDLRIKAGGAADAVLRNQREIIGCGRAVRHQRTGADLAVTAAHGLQRAHDPGRTGFVLDGGEGVADPTRDRIRA
jgi:hypothetical protein